MGRLRALASDVRGGLIELARPGESTLSGLALWRLGAVALSFVLFARPLTSAYAVASLLVTVGVSVHIWLDHARGVAQGRRRQHHHHRSESPDSDDGDERLPNSLSNGGDRGAQRSQLRAGASAGDGGDSITDTAGIEDKKAEV